MDGESTPRVPDWLDPEKLFQFIRELQAAKYNIGVGEYIAAQDLVLALIGRGEDLSHPQRLKTLLGPLLVSTPFEQEDFARRYDLWIQRLGYAAAQEAAPAMPPVVEEKSFLSLRRRWLVILGILFLLLVGSGLIYLFSNGTFNLPAGTVKVPATTTGQAIPTGAVQIPWLWIGGVLVFGALVWLVLRWLNERQAQMFLERHTSRETPQILPLVVQTSPQALEPVYPGLTFLRLAQGLRQRVEMPSTELDVGKTVLQTVKKGGWFTPVYASRPVMPEYLVLVDRSRPGDHQAEFAFEMIRRLRELHVYISGYYFKGDPRLCYPMEGGAPQSLWEITTLRSHHRLILISDAANLINPFSGEPESWIERFAEMPERALLTPEPVERWGYREYQLSEFFTVLPATPEGLELFVQTLRSGEGVLQVEASPGEPLPEALLQDPQRWLSTTPPEPAQVKALLAGLRKHLRADGYTWLCACAIYPELHWELTVFFGEWLQGQPNRGAIEPEALGRLRVLSPRRLMDLARLPWMRHNYIPDWLRLELIGSLSKEQEQELRQALYRLLGSAVVKPEGGMLLEISRSVRRLMPQVARQLSRQEGEDNPYQDRVFLTFLSGRNPNSLAVRLPEALRRALAARPSLRGLVEGMLENLTARREEPVRLEKEARPQPAPLANIRVGQRVLPWWVAYLAWVVLSGLGGLVGGFLGDSIAPDTLTLSWVAANFLAAVGQWLLLRRVLKGFWVWIPANVAVNIFLGVILKTSLSGILIFVTILLSSTGQLVVLERYTRRAWTWPLGSLASFGLLTLIDGISSSFAWSINLALALLIVCLAVIHFLLLTWMLQPAALKPEPKWGQPSERPFAPEAQWPRDRWVILAGWVAAWGLTFLLDLLASSTVWPLITDSATKIMLQNLTFGLLLFAIQWWLLRRYTPIGVDWLWFSLGAGFLATAAIYGAGAVSFPFTFLPGLAVLGVQILLLRPLTRRYLAWVSILIPQIVFGYFLNDYLQGLFTSSIVLQSGGISTQGLAFLAYGLAHASEGAILIWLLAPSARRGGFETVTKTAQIGQPALRTFGLLWEGLQQVLGLRSSAAERTDPKESPPPVNRNIKVGRRVQPWWVVYLILVFLTGVGSLGGASSGSLLLEAILGVTVPPVVAGLFAFVFQWLLLRQVLPGIWVWVPASLLAALLSWTITFDESSIWALLVHGVLFGLCQYFVLERYIQRARFWLLINFFAWGAAVVIYLILVTLSNNIFAITGYYVSAALIGFPFLSLRLNPAALKPSPTWGQPSERPFAPAAQWLNDRWVILGGWAAAFGMALLAIGLIFLLLFFNFGDLTSGSIFMALLFSLVFALVLYGIQFLFLRRYTPMGADWLWLCLGAELLGTAAIVSIGRTTGFYSLVPVLLVLAVQTALLRPLTRRYLAWGSLLVPFLIVVFGYDSILVYLTTTLQLESILLDYLINFSLYGPVYLIEGAFLMWILAPSARRREYTEKEPASKAARRKQVVPRWLRQVGSGLGTTGAVILGLMVLALSSRITWGLGIMLVSLFLSRAFIPGLLINYLNVAFASGFGLFGYGLYRTKRAAFIFQLVMAGATFIFIGNSYTLSTPGSTITFTGIAYSLLFTLATSLGLVLWLAVAERLAEKREGMILLLAEAAGVVSNLIFHGLVFGSLTLTFSSLTSVIQWGIGPFLLGYLPRYLWDVNRKREARAAYLKKHPPKTNKMEAVQSMETESSTTAETPETLTESPQPSEDSQTPADKAQPTTRTLYEWEIREFYPLFGDTLDYSRVRIHENATFTDLIDRIGRRLKGMPPSSEGSHNAITLGNHCYFPVSLPTELLPLDHRENYKLPWLAHEVTHAWQFQQQGWMYLVRAILAQLREREQAYDYGGEDGLAKARKLGRRFADFNPEQQGNIVQTYYARQRAGRESSAFEPFIADLQGRDDTLKVA